MNYDLASKRAEPRLFRVGCTDDVDDRYTPLADRDGFAVFDGFDQFRKSVFGVRDTQFHAMQHSHVT